MGGCACLTGKSRNLQCALLQLQVWQNHFLMEHLGASPGEGSGAGVDVWRARFSQEKPGICLNQNSWILLNGLPALIKSCGELVRGVIYSILAVGLLLRGVQTPFRLLLLWVQLEEFWKIPTALLLLGAIRKLLKMHSLDIGGKGWQVAVARHWRTNHHLDWRACVLEFRMDIHVT